MWMTADEKDKMLFLIEEMKQLNDSKNTVIDNIMSYCYALEKENELLKRQLEIAERYILKENCRHDG